MSSMVTSIESIPLSEHLALKEKYAELKAELAELKRLVYGQKSERHVPEKNSQQLSLEMGQDENPATEPEIETITYNRKKPSKKRSKGGVRVRAALKTEVVELEPSGDVSGMKKIREEITRVLEYEPPKFYWLEYRRSVFAPIEGTGPFLTVPLPFRPIERGLPGPKLSTQVVVDKYVDHCPVARQIKKYSRLGVEIPDSTIDGWIGKYAELMAPLYDCTREEVLKHDYLQADETTLKVLKDVNAKPGKPHLGYLVPCHAPLEKAVFFEYIPRRNQKAQESLLATFKGKLQTDGHNCYDRVARRNDITHIGCMYHGRRKFEKALTANKAKAEHALRIFRLLSEVEERCICPETKAIDYEKRGRLRQRHSAKLMAILKKWMDENIRLLTPKSKLAKAINYMLNRWKELNVFLADAKVEISNNMVENLIRPIAVGRKNWLFSGSPAGAKRAAVFFTLFGSCQLNGIDPYSYLFDVAMRINTHPPEKLAELLPWNWRPDLSESS
jgi:transposase